MRSDIVKAGIERGPHRSLMKAVGLTDADIRRPFIAVVNSYTDAVQYAMPGANLVGTCTETLVHGFEFLGPLLARLGRHLDPLGSRALGALTNRPIAPYAPARTLTPGPRAPSVPPPT